MNAKDEVTSLLARDGAVLVRSACHMVYRLSNGQTYVISATPSDYYAWHNALSNLRSLLGVKREVHKNPNRKRKQGRASTQPNCTFEDVEMRPGWQNQLRTVRAELT
jgi:hypothetical protein